MKLLICTQIVDREDPVLGFFHEWIRACAEQCESVEVLCLKEGVHSLPQNVRIHSLGKEKGEKSRIMYIGIFLRTIWQLRSTYSAVFVHMNPEYVVLGGIFWRILGKKIGLWYAHGAVTRMLSAALVCTHVVFTSTAQGFRLPSSKVHIVGQGIDTDLFSFDGHPIGERLRLVTVGRISRTKDIECLLRAVAILVTKGVSTEFTIVGIPLTEEDRVYQGELKALVQSLGINAQVVFAGAIANRELPKILALSDIFIHAGRTGSLDKVLLESLAVGLPTLSSNDAYPGVVATFSSLLTYTAHDADMLATKIMDIRSLDCETLFSQQSALRSLVVEKHGVHDLMGRILKIYNTTGLHTHL